MQLIKNGFIYAYKKVICYKANLISWFLTDVALYVSTIIGYYFLTMSVSVIGGYTRSELLLYISHISYISVVWNTITSVRTYNYTIVISRRKTRYRI